MPGFPASPALRVLVSDERLRWSGQSPPRSLGHRHGRKGYLFRSGWSILGPARGRGTDKSANLGLGNWGFGLGIRMGPPLVSPLRLLARFELGVMCLDQRIHLLECPSAIGSLHLSVEGSIRGLEMFARECLDHIGCNGLLVEAALENKVLRHPAGQIVGHRRSGLITGLFGTFLEQLEQRLLTRDRFGYLRKQLLDGTAVLGRAWVSGFNQCTGNGTKKPILYS